MAGRRGLKWVVRQMAPHRVAWRAISGGRPLPSRKRLKRRLTARTVATGSQEDYQRMLAAANQPAKKAAVAKTSAKKATGKGRGDVYVAARQLPARNQAAAKKSAATTKRAAGGKVQVPQRNADGTFNGSVTFPTFGPREQAMYERGLTGQVDSIQQVRALKRRSR
jgi:hypothetical protein